MARMISREPTIERLAIAQRLLLEPFGLDESHLSRALQEIRAHRVDVEGRLEHGSWTDPETGFVSLLRIRDAKFGAA